MVPPGGIEPPHLAPEASALSTELRGLTRPLYQITSYLATTNRFFQAFDLTGEIDAVHNPGLRNHHVRVVDEAQVTFVFTIIVKNPDTPGGCPGIM